MAGLAVPADALLLRINVSTDCAPEPPPLKTKLSAGPRRASQRPPPTVVLPKRRPATSAPVQTRAADPAMAHREPSAAAATRSDCFNLSAAAGEHQPPAVIAARGGCQSARARIVKDWRARRTRRVAPVTATHWLGGGVAGMQHKPQLAAARALQARNSRAALHVLIQDKGSRQAAQALAYRVCCERGDRRRRRGRSRPARDRGETIEALRAGEK